MNAGVKKILLSAGPMRTYLDPVRYIQNSSSGLMGLELAKALKVLDEKIEFSFLLGPVDSKLSEEYSRLGKVVSFISADDYEENLLKLFPACDLFISAAAVLDFATRPSTQKQSRDKFRKSNELKLSINPVKDYLKQVGTQYKRPNQKILAFSLDTRGRSSAIYRAIQKLKEKNADWIYLNYASEDSGPEKPTTSGALIAQNELIIKEFENESKSEVAKALAPFLLSPDTEGVLNEPTQKTTEQVF